MKQKWLIILCTAVKLAGQVTGGDIQMLNNASGSNLNHNQISQYSAHYKINVSGIVAISDIGEFNLSSDYYSKTNNGELKDLIYSEKPTNIGFYDLDMALLNQTRIPLNLRMSNRANGELKDDNRISSFQLSASFPKTIYFPAIHMAIQRAKTRRLNEVTSSLESVSIRFGNRSSDDRSAYNVNYSSRQRNNAGRKLHTKSLFFGVNYDPSKNTRYNTSLQLQATNFMLTYFISSNAKFIISEKSHLQSELDYTGSAAHSGTSGMLSTKTIFLHKAKKANLRLYNRLSSNNEAGWSATEHNKGSAGVILSGSFDIKTIRANSTIQHSQNYSFGDRISSESYNSALRVQIPKRLSRRIQTNLTSMIQHVSRGQLISNLDFSTRLALNLTLTRGANLGMNIVNQISYSATSSEIQSYTNNLETKLNFRVLRIPILLGSKYQFGSTQLKSTRDYKVYLKLARVGLGRNGSLSANINSQTKTYRQIDEFDLSPASFMKYSDISNSIMINGQYKFFAYHISGQLFYDLSNGKKSNRYNFSFRRSISFGG